MGNVFFSIGLSLDGFVAGLNASPRNPLGDGGLDIHRWLFLQCSFRRNLKLGDDGETGRRRQDGGGRDIQSDWGEYHRNEVV
jgi:hypothetical protein